MPHAMVYNAGVEQHGIWVSEEEIAHGSSEIGCGDCNSTAVLNDGMCCDACWARRFEKPSPPVPPSAAPPISKDVQPSVRDVTGEGER